MSSDDTPDKITFEGLKKFLRRVGFEQPATIDRSLAFHHPGSGAIVVLSIPNDGYTVRSADLLSMLTRLEHQGLIDEADLAQFRAGRLPMAS